jgi:threonine aldolase
VKKLFGRNAVGFPVFNGTGANVVALQAAIPRWGAVITPESSHLNLDEGGAPEKMGGIKLWTVAVPAGNGKLTPELVATQLFDFGFVHRSQQAAVSFANSTEYGTVYSLSEIKALTSQAKKHGLITHMDGARLSNAAASLGLSFKQFTTDAGIDLVSLGGTKIGAMAAEAIIVTNASSETGKRLVNDLDYLRKTSMQLSSKMRFVSAQLLALFDGKEPLALDLAAHANSMAGVLDRGLRGLARGNKQRLSLPVATEANAVFPIMDAKLIRDLRKKWHFYDWNQQLSQVRLMCAWDTTEQDIELFLGDVKSALKS